MSGPMETIVIVGAGQAGFQAAASLREAGFSGRLTLVGEEAALPYQRPPLSKAYLAGKTDARGLLLRQESFFAEHRIAHRPGTRVTAIDRAGRSDPALGWRGSVLRPPHPGDGHPQPGAAGAGGRSRGRAPASFP